MSNKLYKGFTLIELLVSMVVMITGVVGSVAIQATAKKNSFDAMQRAQATSLAHDIIERIRGNKDQLLNYAGVDYGLQTYSNVSLCHETADSTDAVDCNPSELLTYDKYQWNAALKGANVTKTVSGVNGNSELNVGGLISPTACIFITQATAADPTIKLTNAGTVQVVVTWHGRFATTDANVSNAYDCGGDSINNSRRQVSISAYIF